MKLWDYARLARLFSRLGRPETGRKLEQRLGEQSDLKSANGISYDLYESKGTCRQRFIALHGVTLNGKNDPRLKHFGRCLAASGTTCAIPTLKGLANFQWTPTDVGNLATFAKNLWSGETVGLVGFSYGGSYALLAAAEKTLAPRVTDVIAFGAYHSLVDLHEGYSRQQEKPQSAKEWDNWIYLRLVLAFRNAERFGLSAEVISELESLLKRYCHSSSIEEKRQFLEKHLQKLDLFGIDNETRDNHELEQLSPAGKLGGLQCRANILHDPTDGVVPLEHARRLENELKASGCEHAVLTTELLSHVTPSGAFKVGEWLRLASLLLPLVGSSRQTARSAGVSA